MCTLIIGASNNELTAQQYWGDGYSASYCERGGCHREAESYGGRSIELIPYRQYAGRNANYQTNRLPYHAGFGYGASDYDLEGGCGYGGTCSRGYLNSSGRLDNSIPLSSCRGGNCGYEESQHGHAHGPVESPYRNQDSIGDAYGQRFTAPNRGNNSYQPYAADLRPQINSPSAASEYDYAANERSSFDFQRQVPKTPAQIIPPPKLPPQPGADRNDTIRSEQSRFGGSSTAPQLLPPTFFPQKTRENSPETHDHAGHDHGGHDHNH